MKRQLSLVVALGLGLGAHLFACGAGDKVVDDTFTSTGVTNSGTATGAGTVTGAGTTTGAGSGTTTGTGSGTTTGTGAGTTTGTGSGTGSGVCEDNDYAGWVGGGPGCFDTGGGGTGGAGGASNHDAPNTETNATYLGEIEDPDDCGSVISGVVNGNTDVDWYYYHGIDAVGSLVDPTRDRQQDQDLQICAYVECDNHDDPGVTCSAGSSVQQSGQGLDGCCTTGDTTAFDIDFCCSTACLGSEDANVYISVAGPTLTATACVDYEILFHF